MFSLIKTYKALIITALLSSTVVLLAFNVHLTKRSVFDAETYYELLPEEEKMEEIEELAELMESIDDLLNTNKAFNETQESNEFEDEAFQNTLDKIRNRASKDYEINDHISEPSGAQNSNEEDINSFEDINELIGIRSEEKRESLPSNTTGKNKKSSVSYSLVNRTDEYLPPPIYLCEESGKIVINIIVDRHGIVIETSVNSSSTSSNGCLIDHAIEYAQESKFNPDPSKDRQLGTITFYFRGKF